MYFLQHRGHELKLVSVVAEHGCQNCASRRREWHVRALFSAVFAWLRVSAKMTYPHESLHCHGWPSTC